MTSNGHSDEAAFKNSLNHVLEDVDEVPELSFPIYGNKYITKYLGTYTYVYLVESPGVVFITAGDPPGSPAKAVYRAVVACFPFIFFAAFMAFTSGFIVWIMVSSPFLCSIPHDSLPSPPYMNNGIAFTAGV